MDQKVHDLALKYLNTRDRTAWEIRKYLLSKGIPEAQVEECLGYLSKCGLLDDEDYCERYVLYGIGKGRGPLRLERELTEKGIDSQIIKAGLETHFGGGAEKEVLLSYLNKLLKQLDPDSSEESYYPEDSVFYEEEKRKQIPEEKEIARIGRRLAAQGFHSSIIYEALGRLRLK